jgi:hypothetical protein
MKYLSFLLSKLYFVYLIVLILLFVLPTKGTVQLNPTIFGIRTDLFIHSMLFIPYYGLYYLYKKEKIQFKQAVVTGVFFAAFCESLHLWIPYRSFSGLDFVANICGLTIGFLSFKLINKLFRFNLK